MGVSKYLPARFTKTVIDSPTVIATVSVMFTMAAWGRQQNRLGLLLEKNTFFYSTDLLEVEVRTHPPLNYFLTNTFFIQ